MSYRTSLLFRIAAAAVTGLLLITVVLWVYFRNEVKSIGDYLKYGKREDAVLIITTYLGNPPSKFRAYVLSRTYGITVLYYNNDRLVWVAESRKRRVIDTRPPMMNMMRDMMGGPGRRGGPIDVYLTKARMLRLLFPPVPFHRSITAPFAGALFIIIIIGMIVFLLVRKTLKPVDRIISAAQRVGEGDLTYRIQYDRNDDFKKVADAFNSMTERLSTMLANQRELLHLISHELRTPLARVSLALEMKDRKRSQKVIQEEVRGIDTLVESVLDLSRMDSARYHNINSVDTVALIRTISEEYDGVRFSHDIPVARVNGNELLLTKAFSNLIENAVKYSGCGMYTGNPHESTPEHSTDGSLNDWVKGPAGGPVEIELTGNGGTQYRIIIRNNGPGIEAEELSKIWEPFYRGKNARINRTPGKGLGLVIVKKAIELSDGTITVESKKEGPTVFTVFLPAS